MEYQDYIDTELLVLIPVLYFIGIWLKKSSLPDKWIPLTLGVASVAFCGLWVFATNEVASTGDFFAALFTAVTQGILVAGASVYANQIYIQSKKEE